MDLGRIRRTLGLKQSDVEKATGIDDSTLSLYEHGQRIPTVKNAKKLADYMGFDWTLFFDEGNSKDDRFELSQADEAKK